MRGDMHVRFGGRDGETSLLKGRSRAPARPHPCLRGVLGGSPEYLPHGRTQMGDRHLKFHESRDNLHLTCANAPAKIYAVNRSSAPRLAEFAGLPGSPHWQSV
jgi:hypothetical protein